MRACACVRCGRGVVTRIPAQLAGTELAGDPALAAIGVRAAAAGRDRPAALACRSHGALDGSGRTLPVPVFLTAPDYLATTPAWRRRLGDGFDYAPLGRFSTNSGTAIGATVQEAVVHALAETVERDAYSLLLAATFVLACPPPLRLVRPASLPASLGELHARAKRQVGGPVALIDMTTDLGVPAFCAYASPWRGHDRQGMGASLSARYAAQRALSELIQYTAIVQGERHPPPNLRALAGHPRLLAAGRADFEPHLPRGELRDFVPTRAPATPRGHLQHLTSALLERGHRPYARVLHTEPNQVSTVSVFVPGLERFFNVTSGACIVPGPRGRALARPRPTP